MGWKNSSSRFSSAARVTRATQCISRWRLEMPLGVVDVDAVAAAVLRRVAGDVRGAHDGRDVLGVALDLHDADARADGQRRRAPHEAVVADGLAHALRDARGLIERAALQQHAELVAAEARDGVGGAHARLQQARHVAQQPVAGLVAAGVVDDLELVEVDVQQRVRAFAALRAAARPRAAGCRTRGD